MGELPSGAQVDGDGATTDTPRATAEELRVYVPYAAFYTAVAKELLKAHRAFERTKWPPLADDEPPANAYCAEIRRLYESLGRAAAAQGVFLGPSVLASLRGTYETLGYFGATNDHTSKLLDTRRRLAARTRPTAQLPPPNNPDWERVEPPVASHLVDLKPRATADPLRPVIDLEQPKFHSPAMVTLGDFAHAERSVIRDLEGPWALVIQCVQIETLCIYAVNNCPEAEEMAISQSVTSCIGALEYLLAATPRRLKSDSDKKGGRAKTARECLNQLSAARGVDPTAELAPDDVEFHRGVLDLETELRPRIHVCRSDRNGRRETPGPLAVLDVLYLAERVRDIVIACVFA